MRAMLRTATYTVTLVALAVIVTAAAPEVSRRLFQVPHFRPQGAATQHGFLPPIITDLPGRASKWRRHDGRSAKVRQNVARFRLYRHRSLQVNTRFAAFFKIYQTIYLKFCNLVNVFRFLQK